MSEVLAQDLLECPVRLTIGLFGPIGGDASAVCLAIAQALGRPALRFVPDVLGAGNGVMLAYAELEPGVAVRFMGAVVPSADSVRLTEFLAASADEIIIVQRADASGSRPNAAAEAMLLQAVSGLSPRRPIRHIRNRHFIPSPDGGVDEQDESALLHTCIWPTSPTLPGQSRGLGRVLAWCRELAHERRLAFEGNPAEQ